MTHHVAAPLIATTIATLTAVSMSLFAVVQARKSLAPAKKPHRPQGPSTPR